MKLLYSTNELTRAQELMSVLEEAGIPAHLAGEHVARMPGFGARRVPNALGVWIVDESKMNQAAEALRELGLVAEPTHDVARRISVPNLWVKVAIALFVALGTVLVIKL